ncbi:xylulokinase [Halomonas sp. MA07-2]|uniref:xylulokinase n=1 Tax=Halomonas sp. MA07-2 TaxID=3440841 RepID=UPI003EE89D12
MADDTYLGLDIGTSAVKAVLVDADQRVQASTGQGYAVDYPRPGWAEQPPSRWWQAVEAAMADLRRQAPVALGKVAGIGLSGQMHGLVLQDARGEVLRPAILWNDARAQAECGELTRRLPRLGEITGIGAMPAFWPAKLAWLARHEPEVMARVRYLLLPKDQVRWQLCGERFTDCCDAAGTQLLDQASRQWSPEVLAACAVDPAWLPGLVEGSVQAGRLCPELARRWGLRKGVVIAGGAGDVAAGALGIGAIDEGSAFLTLGTSSQLFVATPGYRPAPERALHAFAHALPGRWFQMAALLNGASALSWAAGLMGVTIEEALARAEVRGGRPESLLFLPYLNGERTPHDDPAARGVLFGLTPASDVGEVTRAVLSGVGYSLREAMGVIEGAGTPIERLAAMGGGTRSDLWLQLLADILERPLVRYRDSEAGPAFGAARLARLAVSGESPDTVCRTPEVDRVFAPSADAGHHAAHYARFRRLYRVLKPEFSAAMTSPRG